MMKFEEEFPSLKGKVDEGNLETQDGQILADWVETGLIMKHCLDKQRVRAVLDEVEGKYYKWGTPDNEEPCVIIQKIRNELGL